MLSEHETARLLDLSSDAIFVWNAERQIEYWNQGAVEVYGYSREEALGRSPHELLRTQFPQSLESIFETAERQGRWTGELIHTRKDGEQITVSSRWVVDRDTRGNISKILETNRDITDRKLAQEALQQSHARLQKALENETVGVMFWDLNTGNMVDANDTFLRMMGYSRSDVEQRRLNWQTLTPPEYIDVSLAEIAKFNATGRVGPYEKEYIRGDGTRRWLVFAGSSLGNNQCVEFCVDIAERKRFETALRDSEQRFKAMAENVPQLLWVADSNADFQYLSPKWLQYTGTTEEENAGGGWLNPIHPEDRARASEAWQRAVQQSDVYEAEFRLRRHDGAYRWHLSRATRIQTAGDRDLWFGTATDVEDQKRAQEVLIRTEKLASVGRMSATVAHEINNPLEVAMNCMYIIGLDPGLSEQTRQVLRDAEQELERVSQLVRRTLGFYRGNTAPAPCDLSELVKDVTEIFRPKLIQRHIELRLELEPSVVVKALVGEIRQVLSNLLSNAIDATAGGGQLRIRTRGLAIRSERFGQITVADTGEGIRHEHLDRIFEPFFTTKETIGTGLGLWVSNEIVRRHGGKIRVRSRGGRGTVFSILLPEDGAAIMAPQTMSA